MSSQESRRLQQQRGSRHGESRQSAHNYVNHIQNTDAITEAMSGTELQYGAHGQGPHALEPPNPSMSSQESRRLQQQRGSRHGESRQSAHNHVNHIQNTDAITEAMSGTELQYGAHGQGPHGPANGHVVGNQQPHGGNQAGNNGPASQSRIDFGAWSNGVFNPCTGTHRDDLMQLFRHIRDLDLDERPQNPGQ